MTVETYRVIAGWLLVVGAIPSFLFVWRYRRAAWRESAMGRHLMVFTATMGMTLGWAATSLWLGPYPGRAVIGLLMYGAIAMLMWRRLVLLVQSQREDDRRRDDVGDVDDDVAVI